MNTTEPRRASPATCGPTNPTSRRLAAVVAGLALALSACGGASNRVGATRTASAASQTEALAFSACMRTHGVPNFPDLTSTTDSGMRIQSINGITKVNGWNVNVAAPAFQSAMQACRSRLPGGRVAQPVSASRRAAILQWAACMRSHRLANFPDPTFPNVGGVALKLPDGIYANSPTFKSAEHACGSTSQELAP